MTRLVAGVERLPGGAEASAEAVARWRGCEEFLETRLERLAGLNRLLGDPRIVVVEDSLLAREHRKVRAEFGAPERLLGDPAGVQAEAQRWLESYRRHYLAWHERLHASARFEELGRLCRGSGVGGRAAAGRSGMGRGRGADATGTIAGRPRPPLPRGRSAPRGLRGLSAVWVYAGA